MSDKATTKTIKLSAEQALVVQQALDAAIRSGGANVAVSVLPIMQHIEGQLTAETKSADGTKAKPEQK